MLAASNLNSSAAQKVDINSNSPSHRSSQDGSFIQDDAEMQLILDLNNTSAAGGVLSSPMLNRHHPIRQNSGFCPSSCLTESWLVKQQQRWATDYDANIAELEFDVDEQLITQNFIQLARYELNSAAAKDKLASNAQSPIIPRDSKMYVSIGDEAVFELKNSNSRANLNNNNNNSAKSKASSEVLTRRQLLPMQAVDNLSLINDETSDQFIDDSLISSPKKPELKPITNSVQEKMRSSLELSSGESLFSSVTGEEQAVEELLSQAAALGHNGYISTDSLDMTELMMDSTHIRTACMANPRDYCLTFSKMTESASVAGLPMAMANSSLVPSLVIKKKCTEEYRDAPLSDAGDFLSVSADDRHHEENSTSSSEQSDSCTLGMMTDRTDATNLTTWGRIKRSYDSPLPGEAPGTPKSRSLPLIGAARELQSGAGGAGEHLSSQQPIPIYDLSVSVRQEPPTAGTPGSGRPRSLYELFVEKLKEQDRDNSIQYLEDEQCPYTLEDTDDELELNDIGQRSSGYVTGDQPARLTRYNDNQAPDYEPQPTRVADYDYVEYYTGDGRYIDQNHNEIGYMPDRMAPAAHQDSLNPQHDSSNEQFDTAAEYLTEEQQLLSARDRWQRPGIAAQASAVPSKPPRTFATLLRQSTLGQLESEQEPITDSKLVNQSSQTSPTHRLGPPQTQHSQSMAGLFSAVPTQPSSIHSKSSSDLSAVMPHNLDFLRMAHDVPQFMPSVPPFPVAFLTNEDHTELDGGGSGRDETDSDKERTPRQQRSRRSRSASQRLADLLAPSTHLQPHVNALLQQCTATSQQLLRDQYGVSPEAQANLPPHLLHPYQRSLTQPAAPSFFSQSPQFAGVCSHELPLPPHEMFLPTHQYQQPMPPMDHQAYQNYQQLPSFAKYQQMNQQKASSSSNSRNGSFSGGNQRSAMAANPKPPSSVANDRDSGLGSSGPSHIHDWDSLATLLPKDVAQACSFFKTNSQLLDAAQTPSTPAAANIDKLPGRRFRPRSEPGRNRRSWQRYAPAYQHRAHSRYECIREDEQQHYDHHHYGCPHKQRYAEYASTAALSQSTPAPFGMSQSAVVHHHHHHHYTPTCCPPTGPPCSHHHPRTLQQHQRSHTADTHNLRRWRHKFMQPAARHDYYEQDYCNVEGVNENGGSDSESDWSTDDMAYRQRHQRNQWARQNATNQNGMQQPPVQYRRGGSVPPKNSHVVSGGAPKLCAKRMSVSTLTSDDENDSEPPRRQHGAASRRNDSENMSHADMSIGSHDPDVMYSEYQLRERDDRCSALPHYYSLQNMRSELANGFGDSLTTGSNGYRLNPKLAANIRQKPCATCYRVRSPTTEHAPPLWAQPNELKQCFCDCQTTDMLEQAEIDRFRAQMTGCPIGVRMKGVHAEERSVIGTTVYREKRELTDVVVRVCDQLVSAFSAFRFEHDDNSVIDQDGVIAGLVRHSLCPAIEKMLADGLLPGCDVWQIVRAAATLGPATKSVHALVADLSSTVAARSCQGAENAHDRFIAFIEGLLRLRSLDCWLSYLTLKDGIINESYSESAFLRRSLSGYRSLFERVIMAIQPLSMLPFHRTNPLNPQSHLGTPQVQSKAASMHAYASGAFMPTRLPSDSRVPKSSSLPAKLSEKLFARPRSKSAHDTLVALPHTDVQMANHQTPKKSATFEKSPLAGAESNSNLSSRTPVSRPPSSAGSRIPVMSRPTSLGAALNTVGTGRASSPMKSATGNGSRIQLTTPRAVTTSSNSSTSTQSTSSGSCNQQLKINAAKPPTSTPAAPKRTVAVTKTVMLRMQAKNNAVDKTSASPSGAGKFTTNISKPSGIPATRLTTGIRRPAVAVDGVSMLKTKTPLGTEKAAVPRSNVSSLLKKR